MSTLLTVVDTLEERINYGAFASQLTSYLNSNFRYDTSDRETFYKRAIAEGGYAEAERKLTEWVKGLHYDTYSAIIEPVARGILALAKAKPELLTDITHCEIRGYQAIDERYGPRYKFVVFNMQAPGCGCSQPKGSSVFGPYGHLGIKAVILETGYGYDGPQTNVQFVIPAWGSARRPPQKGEFVIAKIETTGSSDGCRYTPCVMTEEGDKEIDDVEASLKHVLGMAPIENFGAMMEYSGIDQVVGFPGAEEYLAAKLPDLGDYFVALAEKLSKTHAH